MCLLCPVYTVDGSAVEGSDFVSIPVTQPQLVTIGAGETCTFVLVGIISDLTPEMIGKSFRIIMFNPQPSSSMIHLVASNSQTTITIIDDEPGKYALIMLTYSVIYSSC